MPESSTFKICGRRGSLRDHHRLRSRPAPHPGLGIAHHRAGARGLGRITHRRARHRRQARTGTQAATAARTHHSAAESATEVRHADDRHGVAAANGRPLKEEAPHLAGLLQIRPAQCLPTKAYSLCWLYFTKVDHGFTSFQLLRRDDLSTASNIYPFFSTCFGYGINFIKSAAYLERLYELAVRITHEAAPCGFISKSLNGDLRIRHTGRQGHTKNQGQS